MSTPPLDGASGVAHMVDRELTLPASGGGRKPLVAPARTGVRTRERAISVTYGNGALSREKVPALWGVGGYQFPGA